MQHWKLSACLQPFNMQLTSNWWLHFLQEVFWVWDWGSMFTETRISGALGLQRITLKSPLMRTEFHIWTEIAAGIAPPGRLPKAGHNLRS